MLNPSSPTETANRLVRHGKFLILMLFILTCIFFTWFRPAISSSAEIYGQVTDANGSPVSNAQVLACKPACSNGSPKRIGRTDDSGVYSFTLSPGNYEFTIKGEKIPIWVSLNGNR